MQGEYEEADEDGTTSRPGRPCAMRLEAASVFVTFEATFDGCRRTDDGYAVPGASEFDVSFDVTKLLAAFQVGAALPGNDSSRIAVLPPNGGLLLVCALEGVSTQSHVVCTIEAVTNDGESR
eukprot:GHVU01019176.1.p2 GENE.GHVU01019176.1~~GHVU01019176.1.p2  ORF type:complete len:122 (+),score=18.76 GHVU01019176.1:623-988(+)